MFDRINTNIILVAIFCLLLSFSSFAQTSEFTFQGKLTDQGAPANGVYDLSFKLYDAANLQIGSTLTREDIQVTNGVFTVPLNFGANAFDGGSRMIEISVRPGGSTGSFTVLSPKQEIKSTPYAVRSLKAGSADVAGDASLLGGVSASQFVQTNDTRLTDARNPLPGNESYIQNTGVRQPGAQFNISGNGIAAGMLSAGDVNAENAYRLTGLHFLSSNSLRNSIYMGFAVGTQGTWNTLVGYSTGATMTGSFNSLFGSGAGARVSTGEENANFGYLAGDRITTGKWNSFFGSRSGWAPTAVQITGNGNSVFGHAAGTNLGTGSSNTLIGHGANVRNGGISFSTAIGHNAIVDQDFSVVVGDTTTKVGIGVSAPEHKLHVIDPTNKGLRVQTNQPGGTVASFGGSGEFRVDAPGVVGGRFVIRENGMVGIGTTQPAKSLEVLGDIRASSFSPGSYPRFSFFYPHANLEMRKWQVYTTGSGLNFSALNNAEDAEVVWMQVARTGGTTLDRIVFPNSVVALDVLGTGGSLSLCWNSAHQISTCSSSIQYKQNIHDYSSGLDVLKRLRPVSFNWKADDKPDLGLVAEEAGQVEPLLATYDDKGQIEGVKYDRVGVILINAVKEQQTQIDAQSRLIARQQQQIDALTKLVCALNAAADVCK